MQLNSFNLKSKNKFHTIKNIDLASYDKTIISGQVDMQSILVVFLAGRFRVGLIIIIIFFFSVD